MQPANIAGSFLGGAQGGARIADFKRQGEMRNYLAENMGPVMAGDQNALAGLAALDPGAAMSIYGDVQNRALEREKFDYARGRDQAADARADEALRLKAAELAAGLSAQERAEQARKIEEGLSQGVMLFQRGDLEGLNQMVTGFGLPPLQSLEEFPTLAARYETVYDTLTRAEDFGAEPEGTARDIQIAALLRDNPGMDARTATGLVDGTIRLSTDPVTGERSLVDMGAATLSPLQTQGAPALGQPAPQGAPPAVTNAPQSAERPSLSFGGGVPNGGQNAFGLRGLAAGAANAAADFVGAEQPFPGIAEHQRFFRALEEDGLVSIVQRYPRMPARDAVERLRRLLPNVGTMEGASQARGEMEQLQRRFADDAARLRSQAEGRMQADDRRVLLAQAQDFERMAGLLQEGITRLTTPGERGQGGNRTSSGVSWEVVE